MFMAGGRNKAILRDALAPVITPEVLELRKKFVRPGSARHLMYDRLYETLRDTFASATVKNSGLWRPDIAERFERGRQALDPDAALVWFRFYMLNRWQELLIG
jgi:hypothetical protein